MELFPRGLGIPSVDRRHVPSGEAIDLLNVFVSHKMFAKLFGKSPFPHKFVELFLSLVIVKDKLTDLWGMPSLKRL